MDYQKTARQVLEKIGGRDNIISAAHCATRLRLVIKDNDVCDSKAVEDIDGVKGVFFAQGQLQIIFGTGIVNNVYDAFIKEAGITESSKEEVKQAANARQNIFKRAIKTLGDIFVPIIPAIVASGFLMGIMEALNFMVSHGFVNISTTSSVYVFAQLFSNTAYTFLPILIAYSAGKAFGANPYLAAVIGMIMIHPDLQNAWTVATEGVHATQPVFFGLYSVDMVGYQGHVIPVIIAVWVLAFIEKRLHKIVPAAFDLFVTPLVSVFVTGYLTLAAIGPVFVTVENFVINGIQTILTLPFGLGSLVVGFLYAITVVAGIHHMYTTIDIGQLAAYNYTYWLPLASAANVAQGAASLAVGIKAKDKKVKSLALPSSLSAFMGITEPAIFGVNLRYFKPFICACVGGGVGAMYASIVGLGATGTGVTGIFGILLCLHDPLNYIIAMLIAAGVSFVLTWLFGFKNPKPETVQSQSRENALSHSQSAANESSALESGETEHADENGDPGKHHEESGGNGDIVFAPIKGEVIPMKDVPDETFAAEVLGKGAAIIPAQGKVFAPFDGTVSLVFDTKHAIALTSDKGTELLIHIGINTVELKGQYYHVHVKDGDRITMGQLIAEFDMEDISRSGYNLTTPVIVNNTDEFKSIQLLKTGNINEKEPMLQLDRE
ncbi:MAG TPA: PTS glucose transporter subunit IIA [Candidatus Scybalocola faecavium]|nr:PTS glucose transporter subunit IIA [Candidatus Scybalocola faecavium]